MKNKFFTKYIYGTQYYRAPTPLPEEWKTDLEKMHETGIDTIQLRIQWRWNESSEGKYEFGDIDELFDLAEKYHKKVIIKFMMETAPDYIFHKYGGTRIDMHGKPISPGAHGAYYVGGWWPCFENPDVMRKALDFVTVFTNRYKDKKSLILWNIWNEPRTRPIGDCACEHSRKVYRKWLEDNYKTIENLNRFFGKKWESFETVNPPGMPQDYAELFLWRKWAMYAVSERLDKMYKAVKSIDSSRPVMTHVGGCSVLQDVAGDGSDDILNSSKVDFYGTSFPSENELKNINEECWPFMICDWLRSVSEYYWVYELYPDWGDWNKPVKMEDYELKVLGSLACGAKGLLYWQYRAERLGNENNLAGLVNIDGSFKKVSRRSGEIRKFIDKNEEFLLTAEVKHDGIGILYSQDSDLINRIENTGKGLNDFSMTCDYPYLYKKALFGAYALLRELGYTTNFIDSRNIAKSLKDIKVLYIPEAFMLSEAAFKAIKNFADNGGYVIAEEGIGLRQENTWLNSTWPRRDIADFFGVSVTERVSTRRGAKDSLKLYDKTIDAVEFISYIECKNSEKIGKWLDGRCGAAKKENAFYIGTSLGASFHDNLNDAYDDMISVLETILKECGIVSGTKLPKGVYQRTLKHGEKEMQFFFNRNHFQVEININGKIIKIAPRENKYYENT